jgi:TetR/AcrR family transcriptional regulator, repressor for lfrA
VLKNHDRIIQAGLQLLAKNPAASMDQIADAAGVGRATLYRQFRSKELLVQELYFNAHQVFQKTVLPILEGKLEPFQKLEKAVKALIPLGASFQFMMYEPWNTGNPEIEQLFADELKAWRALISELKSAKLINPAFSNAWVALCLDSMIYASWQGIYNGDIAPNDACTQVVHTLMYGVGIKTEKENG